jgi:hypothetical protein
VKWRRSKVATSVSLSRSATARRGELGIGGDKYAQPLRLMRAEAVRQVVPVVIVVSCGRAACRRAGANGAVAVAAGRPLAAWWSPPWVLCPSRRGQVGTIMAGFVPNEGYECSKNCRDGGI